MCKTLKDLKVYPVELTRTQRIQQVAYLIVTGELLNPEQGRGIIVSLGLLEMALGIQKRRRLGEKDTKGSESGVCDGVTGVAQFLTPCSVSNLAEVRYFSSPLQSPSPAQTRASSMPSHTPVQNFRPSTHCKKLSDRYCLQSMLALALSPALDSCAVTHGTPPLFLWS